MVLPLHLSSGVRGSRRSLIKSCPKDFTDIYGLTCLCPCFRDGASPNCTVFSAGQRHVGVALQQLQAHRRISGLARAAEAATCGGKLAALGVVGALLDSSRLSRDAAIAVFSGGVSIFGSFASDGDARRTKLGWSGTAERARPGLQIRLELQENFHDLYGSVPAGAVDRGPCAESTTSGIKPSRAAEIQLPSLGHRIFLKSTFISVTGLPCR